VSTCNEKAFSGYESGDMRKLLRLLGFAAAAFFAFRWLSRRISSDTAVDAAPPLPQTAGEAVATGRLDSRDAMSVSPSPEL
jgi:hypothetical protein